MGKFFTKEATPFYGPEMKKKYKTYKEYINSEDAERHAFFPKRLARDRARVNKEK